MATWRERRWGWGDRGPGYGSRWGWRRGDDADDPGVGGAGAAVFGVREVLARLIALATLLVVGVIVLAIVLVALDANAANAIVKFIEDVARTLTTPFHGIFSPSDHKLEIALNWGLAAVVYFIV